MRPVPIILAASFATASAVIATNEPDDRHDATVVATRDMALPQGSTSEQQQQQRTSSV